MSKESKTKLKRRSQVKNPALIKRYNHRLRQEYLDYDYLDKLSEEELTWLNKFSEEYNNDNYETVDGQLDENGNKILDPTKNIHQTQEHKKALDDANNARNRCQYGQLKNKTDKFKNTKLLNWDFDTLVIENHLSREINPRAIEDAYVNFLESKSITEMLEEYDQALSEFSEDQE